jgi:PPOX class probable F420-dependent enzyme
VWYLNWLYNDGMSSQIPPAIQGQKYIRLTTFRKNSAGVGTPVWFGEDNGRLYVMTRSVMGKCKRIRNNPRVKVAPCTVRGVVTGAEFDGLAKILPPEEHRHAREAINRKYWMARIPFLWWRTDAYLEISFS